MARRLDKNKAIRLRLQGKSYSEIKTEISVSKSTLSIWLQPYPLTPNQVARIRNKRPQQIEKFRRTMATRREALQKRAYDDAQKFWLPLSPRELMLAGVFLYWGEGTKVSPGYLCISNCDPRVIKFAYKWMTGSLGIDKKSIHVLLHLYSDMSIEYETKYWSNLLKIPLENFRRPYIKQSTRAGLSYKSFGHGTCNIYTGSTAIKSRVMESINAISDHYSKVI